VREPRRPDTVFWVEPASVQGSHLTLSRDESHHLLDVFRASVGTPFDAIDGAGSSYTCVLESAERGIVVGRVVDIAQDRGELSNPLILLVGLPDPGAAETVVAHVVPLGAAEVDFVSCERSGRPALTPSKLERLDRVARSATKQSRRSRLAAIRSSASLESALESLRPGPRFLADPGGSTLGLGTNLAPEASISMAVGPPGGFAEGELERLGRAGFHPIFLGPSRLTTETAAIAMLSLARNGLIASHLDPI